MSAPSDADLSVFVRELLLKYEAEANESGYSLLNGADLDSYLEKVRRFAVILGRYAGPRPVGFVVYYCNDIRNSAGFISMLLVDACFRGSGVGKELICSALSDMKSKGYSLCSLKVHTLNTAAKSLYSKLGFQIVGVGEGYIEMVLDLNSIVL